MPLQLPASSVARLLAQIIGPSIYDALIPRFRPGVGELVSGPQPQPWHVLGALTSARQLQPWQTVLLNPQPLPPRESIVLALADAHIHELLSVDRLSGLMGEAVTERALDRAVQHVS